MKTEDPVSDYSFSEIPDMVNDSEVLYHLQTRDVNWQYVDSLKAMTDLNDEVISDWLNVSVKTFRSYRQPENKLKENIKEHVLLLVSFAKHGISVLGSPKAFDQWLNSPNFFLDNKAPTDYLNTITGIRYVDSRLTAMEYGDNV